MQESLVIVQWGNEKTPSLLSGCMSPAYRAAAAEAATASLRCERATEKRESSRDQTDKVNQMAWRRRVASECRERGPGSSWSSRCHRRRNHSPASVHTTFPQALRRTSPGLHLSSTDWLRRPGYWYWQEKRAPLGPEQQNRIIIYAICNIVLNIPTVTV